MTSLFSQILALLILTALVSLGWRLWSRPYGAAIDLQAKGMLALAILAITGGVVGSPFWWMNYPDSFSWKLPPLAARLLACAGFAFAVTGAYVLQRKQAQLVRPYIWLLAVYLAPLVVAVVLFHLDRFDWHAPITYAFFVIAGGMAAASIWHLARGTKLPELHEKNRERPLSSIARAYLRLVAALMGTWGLAIFIWPLGPLPQIWLWPDDPLTSRLIATMLITISTAAMMGTNSVSAAKMTSMFLISYGTSVTVAGLWNLVSGKPTPLVYVAGFSVLAITSLLMATSLLRSSQMTPG